MSNRLPRDLWTEILVCLPVKSLLRFRCVCKSWKSLISTPTFISMHTQHGESTGNYTHLLHCDRRYEERWSQYQLLHIDASFSEFQELAYPPQIRDRDYQVLDCKGLILFTTSNSLESLILWNPATRMPMLTLPQACIYVPIHRSKYFVYGFGFDHTSNDYKVLRMAFGTYIFPRAQLYKLRTGAWETFRIADDFQYSIVEGNSQALVNGASHWIGYHSSFIKPEYSDELVVVLFDMCDEKLRVMKLPYSVTSYSMDTDNSRLGISSGLLCLMEHNPRRNDYWNWNVWLMKEYGIVESWSKQFTIGANGYGLFSFRNNEKILVQKPEKFVLYDLKTHRFISLGGIKAKGFVFATNTFVESLVLFNGPEEHARIV
jgi:F-box interacting protein